MEPVQTEEIAGKRLTELLVTQAEEGRAGGVTERDDIEPCHGRECALCTSQRGASYVML